MIDFTEQAKAPEKLSDAEAPRQVKRGAIPSPPAVKETARTFVPEIPAHDSTDPRRE